MKIFLSHSGARSRAVATALNDWLKRVIQAVKPFYSPEIEKGAKWSNELDVALEGTRFGIICLTPDNLNSTWIHYEAGALSKTPDALIWTFLHGINPGDVPQPLGKYQHTIAEKDDVLKLLRSINGRLSDVGGEPIDGTLLTENFEVFWPKLEEKLNAVEKIEKQNTQIHYLDEREKLTEILETVREQYRVSRETAREEHRLVMQRITQENEIKDQQISRMRGLLSSGVDAVLADYLTNNPDETLKVVDVMFRQRRKEQEMLRFAASIEDPRIRDAMIEAITNHPADESVLGSAVEKPAS